MSIFQYKELGDTVTFPMATNADTGSADDGTSLGCDVRLAGAAASAAPVYSATPFLLTHANYANGSIEVSIPATTGNGFAKDSTYWVFGNATVATAKTPVGVLGGFYLVGTNSGSGSFLLETTIATLASQTSFTLTAGSADNSAYPAGSMVIVTDATTDTQKAVGYLLTYTGATKTVALIEDPAVFTMAVGDKVEIIAPQSGILKAGLTENYPVDGQSAMSLEEGIYALVQTMTEFSRSGTTITVKKRDATTTAFTTTIDSATTPTSNTQAS